MDCFDLSDIRIFGESKTGRSETKPSFTQKLNDEFKAQERWFTVPLDELPAHFRKYFYPTQVLPTCYVQVPGMASESNVLTKINKAVNGYLGINPPLKLVVEILESSIEDNALLDNKNLVSLEIVSSILESFGSESFRGCVNLEYVDLSKCISLQATGSYTFRGDAKLAEILLPENISGIGNWTFYGCSSLSKIGNLEKATSIGAGAFYKCTSLTEVKLSDMITSIPSKAFNGCTNLKAFNVPVQCDFIHKQAFEYSGLENAYLVGDWYRADSESDAKYKEYGTKIDTTNPSACAGFLTSGSYYFYRK